MKIEFNIEYYTQVGEQVVLNVPYEVDGVAKVARYHMSSNDQKHWTYVVNGNYNEGEFADYYYSIEANGAEVRHEWLQVMHRIEAASKSATHYIIYDHWIDVPSDSFKYSSAFTECVSKHSPVKISLTNYPSTINLKVRAPQLRQGQALCIIGEGALLGNWSLKQALPMEEHNFNEWFINIDATKLERPQLVFKFVAVDNNPDDNVEFSPEWELGENRYVDIPVLEEGDVIVYELSQANFNIYDPKVAGTLVPLFSLRSKESFGIGDFGDLKKMIDWIKMTRQHVLQILPINDTTITHTWTDSYPYSAISVFALHPQYASLKDLPALADKETAARFEALREELNALPQIDYERVNNAKTEYLQLLFKQEGRKMLASAKFKKFFEEEKRWLVPYAEYCAYRDEYGTADFNKWPKHREYEEKKEHKATPHEKFFYFVQYILCTQMKEVHEYARNNGVILKGDIPIGVNRNGCDVWMEPRYFNLNGQAGAPPDAFSANGQNWGFPTYNWDEMLKDGCQWWERRFQNMAKYFDAYRIDHVLGFFRIWEIPIDSVHGLLGQFAPALAMTREEITAYGLPFRDEFLEPYITDYTLQKIFGDKSQIVKDNYLETTANGRYKMKDEFNTQRKVQAYFEGKNDNNLRDGLYALISCVLFLRDHKNPEKFHPRITAQYDYFYESLSDTDKFNFNRLYNDYYYKRNNQFWYREAMKKLPKLVQATRMLACAEDLGMVPDCVPWVMQNLRILSLELQWMPKNSKYRFGRLKYNPYLSVATISSHDMPTLRMWWDEDYERTQEYYTTVLRRTEAAPHPIPGWLVKDIISRHLTSASMLCIFAIQDWLGMDETLRLPDANAERVNIPANPQHYWRYRMHLNIEDLVGDESFTQEIRELITLSGRK